MGRASKQLYILAFLLIIPDAIFRGGLARQGHRVKSRWPDQILAIMARMQSNDKLYLFLGQKKINYYLDL